MQKNSHHGAGLFDPGNPPKIPKIALAQFEFPFLAFFGLQYLFFAFIFGNSGAGGTRLGGKGLTSPEGAD